MVEPSENPLVASFPEGAREGCDSDRGVIGAVVTSTALKGSPPNGRADWATLSVSHGVKVTEVLRKMHVRAVGTIIADTGDQ